ncbi:peptidylprolyl isomerase [Arcobacter sp. 15-2]|uniref:FKBP-type peptidyl-prolyl cis-trans isomerase n=1 Tax=Arcobacter sp. 15-2 TaxID=3374109 RepID=UPI00399CF0DC
MSNKVISIEYALNDAETKVQLDTNIGGAPLEFITDMGQIIPGLEKELVNLNSGDKTDVLVQPADAYGEYNAEALQVLPKEQFAGIELVEGMSLYGTGENGETVQVAVKSIAGDDVTIDYNHPMAGKTLMFSVSILDVRAATEEEIQTGVVGGMAAAGGCCGGGSCGTDDSAAHSHDHGSEGGCCSSEPAEQSSGGCCSH